MNFFKKLFSKDTRAIPTPTISKPTQYEPEEEQQPISKTPQQELELEPIVVQAIETLYPNIEDQKQAIEFAVRYKKYQTSSDNVVLLLALLAYSDGKIEKLLALEPNAIRNYQFMLDEIAPRFPDMKAAEAWVNSITKK